MTFDELVLLMAIRQLPERWGDLPTDAQRHEFARQVAGRYAIVTGDVMFPFSVDDVVGLGMSLRKNKANRVKADIAIAHGAKCFWQHRGKGPCSNEAEAGHVIARCNNGELTVENGMIECRAHNNQRREMTIERYLASDLTTELF